MRRWKLHERFRFFEASAIDAELQHLLEIGLIEERPSAHKEQDDFVLTGWGHLWAVRNLDTAEVAK